MWLLGDNPHLLNNVSISQNYLRQDELQLEFFNLNSNRYLYFKRLTMSWTEPQRCKFHWTCLSMLSSLKYSAVMVPTKAHGGTRIWLEALKEALAAFTLMLSLSLLWFLDVYCTQNCRWAISSASCPWPWQGGWNWVIFRVPSNPNHSINGLQMNTGQNLAYTAYT